MNNISQYELLLRMGVTQYPVTNQCNAFFPRYVGFYSGCDKRTPTHICEHKLADLDDEALTVLLQEFNTLYPELGISLHDDNTGLSHYLAKSRHIACLYPQYTCLDSRCEKQKCFLLLAHYLTLDKDPSYKQNVLSSASVGDASTSFDTSFTNNLNKNPFFLWLSKTKYGNELLTLIRMNSGVVVV